VNQSAWFGSVVVRAPRPTQPPTFSGTGSECQQKRACWRCAAGE